MQRQWVNFGAAVAAAVVLVACNNTAPAPRQADSAIPGGQRTLNAPDPLVVAADRGRIAGDSTAGTWVVIASDFQCPFCREWHAKTYRQFMNTYVKTGKVRAAYLNFPLNQHRNAVPAANAAMCASAQNHFWDYHDRLFEAQARWAAMSDARPVFESIARDVSLDFPAWATCLDSERMLPLIFADRDRAAAGGVGSTPSFLVGGEVLAGALPFEEMRPFIDLAIAKDRAGTPR